MMKRGYVYQRGVLAGCLEWDGERYRFVYETGYLEREGAPPVSLTLPRRAEPYVSEELFAFFFGLLSEGSTRQIQCRVLRIDERDDFELLLQTGLDTVGSVAIVEDEGCAPAPHLEERGDG